MNDVFISKKFPDEMLDYSLNWSDWLDNDSISNSSWEVTPGIKIEYESFDDTTATIWVSGGTPREEYKLVNTITTAGGRVVINFITLVIKKPPLD
jgi:hypothetical protein